MNKTPREINKAGSFYAVHVDVVTDTSSLFDLPDCSVRPSGPETRVACNINNAIGKASNLIIPFYILSRSLLKINAT